MFFTLYNYVEILKCPRTKEDVFRNCIHIIIFQRDSLVRKQRKNVNCHIASVSNLRSV